MEVKKEMVDYMAAIKKPFEDVKTLVIGIIIGLIPIVSLLNTGYGVLTAKNVLAGDKKLLPWNFGKLVDMIVGLIIVLIISIVYAIPGLILFAIGLAGAIGILLGGIANPNALVPAILSAIAAGGLFLLIGALLWIIAGFLLPMAIMNYIKTNNLGAAFDFKVVLKKALRINYIVSLVVLIIYSFVLAIIFGIISLIPIIGALIGYGLMSFLTAVTSYTIFAETYAEE